MVPIIAVAAVFLGGCAVAKLPLAVVDSVVGSNMSGINTPERAEWSPKNFDPSPYKKISVYTEDLTKRRKWDNDERAERILEDTFSGQLLEKGYRLAARSDVSKIRKEIEFQQKGVDGVRQTEPRGLEDNEVARFGKMINVPAVLLVTIGDSVVQSSYNGSVTVYEARATVSARLINVESGERVGSSSHSTSMAVRDQEDFIPAIAKAAKVVANSIPQHGSSALNPTTK